MKKWKDRFLYSSFDRKMQLIVTIAIVFTTMLVLLVSTFSSVNTMKDQSLELLEAQNTTIVENFGNSLESYRTMAVATILDASVQEYAKIKNMDNQDGYVVSSAVNVYHTLESINNMFSNLNFIALIKHDSGEYVFAGKDPITTTRLLQNYREDERQGKHVRDSALKMTFSKAYYGGDKYSLNIYFPIYDAERVFYEYGLLCMSIDDPVLEQVMSYSKTSGTELMIIDTEGKIVASGREEEIGQTTPHMDVFNKGSGYFIKSGRMYIYQKVEGWNYYVVSSVSTMKIYASSIRVIAVLTFLMSCVVVGCARTLRKIIQMAYQPLDKVVKKMDDVASGSLTTRMNTENMGEDFQKLAVGFNSMMEEIQELMEQVKQEQHQIEQIRFNALQSQIQPHFLYNTLECIHWQAIADGNQETSTLVKALAKYYRICLSKGQDVIPLSMELEHIRNYLIIQNMRYDNIIESIFEIDESITDLKMPKLTLQPLVENSIYHGMKIKEGKKGILYVSAQREGENIRITVSDTGTGMEQEKIDEMNSLLTLYDESFGYGVRNVNKRIELLFGKEYGLHYLKNESGGVTVEILLPYNTEAQESILRGEV